MQLFRLALAAMPLLLAAQQPAPVQPQRPQGADSQPTKPEDKCTIEGQVVNSVTGDPLRKAKIIIRNMSAQNRSGYSAVTDAGGHYMVPDIDPGQYHLSASRNGFVPVQYGARRPDQGSGMLTLTAGQHMRDVAFRLVPQGVITGRVLDEDGEPVEYAQVTTMRYGFREGKRQLMPAGSGGATDDLGEFRIFELAPGKYYFSAAYPRHNSMAQDHTTGDAAGEGYARTYYPGTTDPAGAVSVEVGPGATLNLADLTLRKTRTVHIRGHVVNAGSEGLPQHVALRLMPRNTAYMGFFNSSMAQVMRSQGGAFELRDVTPGAYVLWASWWDGEKSHQVRQPLDVGSTNMDDVSMLLTPGLEVKGQVRIEGNADVNFGPMWVELETQTPFPMGRTGARVEDDRSFTVEDVSADKFMVALRGLPENFYVKSIRMGDADALDSALDLSRGVSGVLDILVSPGGGQIEGAVTDPKQQLATGATVVLVPDERHREQSSLFKTARTDQYGHFTLKGIAPGDYKLFAWDEIEIGAYRDPDFLKPFESDGEAIIIREGSRESRQLKLITADTVPPGAGH